MTEDGVFSGTVEYYARYRPDFPDAAYDAIATTFELDGRGTLLDLGTGTGHIALRLAERFEAVIGVDLSDEMLAVARTEATARGASNVEWRRGRAEELDLAAGTIRLVTIGNALHWFDREAVLAQCHALLERGGGIAVLDMPGMWSPSMELGEERWLAALGEVVERHLGSRRRAGDGYYEAQHEPAAAALERAGFEQVETGSAAAELTWSIDEVVGYLYSTSFANRSILGDRTEAFEADLRQALATAEPSGRFPRRLEVRWALGHRLA